MKKTLVALAALAATGAFAQSSVTLYGAVDASYSYMSSGDVSASKLTSSQLGSSKLGFMGTEDLGGGLKANFKLEGGLNNDTGAGKATNTNNQATGASSTQAGLTFQRFAYVGLSGGFGELRLGREYNNTFLQVQAAVDPFGTNGPADSTQMMLRLGAYEGKSANEINVSNSIGYTTPSMGGFSANAQYFMGENASNDNVNGANNGNGYSIMAMYAAGPLFISAGQTKTGYGTWPTSMLTSGDFTMRALSASYNLGVAKIVGTIAHEEAAMFTSALAGVTPTNDSYLLGVIVPMGAANFKASWVHAARNSGLTGATDQTGNLLGLGVDYALSKRTVAYATYANVSNSDGVAGSSPVYSTGISDGKTNNSSSNFAIGVYHKF